MVLYGIPVISGTNIKAIHCVPVGLCVVCVLYYTGNVAYHPLYTPRTGSLAVPVTATVVYDSWSVGVATVHVGDTGSAIVLVWYSLNAKPVDNLVYSAQG